MWIWSELPNVTKDNKPKVFLNTYMSACSPLEGMFIDRGEREGVREEWEGEGEVGGAGERQTSSGWLL